MEKEWFLFVMQKIHTKSRKPDETDEEDDDDDSDLDFDGWLTPPFYFFFSNYKFS